MLLQKKAVILDGILCNMNPTCSVYRLGLMPYRLAWDLQNRLAEEIARGDHPAALLLLEHPHTYTFGRRGHIENLLWDQDELARRGVSVYWVDRGGDVTYHGPGQLVGYPLLPLAPGGLFAAPATPAGTTATDRTSGNEESLVNEPHTTAQRLPRADYVGYLRRLEETLILALMRLGLVCGQIEGLTGVWVQPDVLSRCRDCAPDLRQPPAKIASIGVKVDARGISRHGFALNVQPDLSYFDGMIGCGLKGYANTSLAELFDPPPAMERVMQEIIAAFGEVFHYQMVERPLPADWLAENGSKD